MTTVTFGRANGQGHAVPVSVVGPGVSRANAPQGRVIASGISPAMAGFVSGGVRLDYQYNNYNGTATLRGYCRAGVTPLYKMLVFLKRMDSPETFIRDTLTAEDGSFVFDNLAYGRYIVEAVDPTGVRNGQIRQTVLAY